MFGIAILAPLGAFFSSALGWLSVVFGPVVLRALPWLRMLPGASTIWKGAKYGAWIAVLCVGVWGGIRLHKWWQGDVLTVKQANAQCLTKIEAANVKALQMTLALKETRLAAMAERLDRESLEIEQKRNELEAHRAPSTDDDDPVFLGDDPWLQSKQRR